MAEPAGYLLPIEGFSTPRLGLAPKSVALCKSPTLPRLRGHFPQSVYTHSVVPAPRSDSGEYLHLPTLPRACLSPVPPASVEHTVPCAVGSLSQIGRRGCDLKPQNQDRMLVASPLPGHSNAHLFAVFDGHGEEGHYVSQFLKENVPSRIAGILSAVPNAPVSVLIMKLSALFAQLQSDLTSSTIDAELSGSTAVLTLIVDDLLVCANVGDSRALLLRKEKWWKVKSVSRDHKPESKSEGLRISQHHGVVRATCDPSLGPIGPQRVFAPNKDYPGLAMSRSLGDALAHRFGVSAEPEILIHRLSRYDRCLVLGSDGVFDVMSNEEVMTVAKRFEGRRDAQNCARQLGKVATSRWEHASPNVDDISVIVVYFH